MTKRVEKINIICFSVYLAYYINFITLQTPSSNIIFENLSPKYNPLKFKVHNLENLKLIQFISSWWHLQTLYWNILWLTQVQASETP